MATITLDVKGISEASSWLDPKRLNRAMQDGIKEILTAGRARAAVRPPEGPWNNPANPTGRWYQRGYGSRWRRADGTIGSSNNSENLQQSWKWERKGPLGGSIYTGVSYSPYLHKKGETVSWAAEHGWQTDEEIAADIVENIAQQAIEKAVNKNFG